MPDKVIARPTPYNQAYGQLFVGCVNCGRRNDREGNLICSIDRESFISILEALRLVFIQIVILGMTYSQRWETFNCQGFGRQRWQISHRFRMIYYYGQSEVRSEINTVNRFNAHMLSRRTRGTATNMGNAPGQVSSPTYIYTAC